MLNVYSYFICNTVQPSDSLIPWSYYIVYTRIIYVHSIICELVCVCVCVLADVIDLNNVRFVVSDTTRCCSAAIVNIII